MGDEIFITCLICGAKIRGFKLWIAHVRVWHADEVQPGQEEKSDKKSI